MRIPDLNLKFVVHTGPVVRQEMAGLEELIGRDVIVVHRLLKNSVGEASGATAYALLTDDVTTAMRLEPAALGMTPHAESYDIVGEIPGWVVDLERRWQEEDDRARIFVDAASAAIDVAMPTAAPPQMAWEYLTKPGRRVAWSHGVTEVIVDAAGNRRGVGAMNHCMHGKDEILEEILDWRPFDYFTLRSLMHTPAGPLRFLTTFELVPTADGTIVHMRIGAGDSAPDSELLAGVLPMFEPIFKANGEALRELVAVDIATREEAASLEPELPAPAPGGEFADLPPIQYVG
jgi:uncharacterized protein YndB with AHSA1/START domain